MLQHVSCRKRYACLAVYDTTTYDAYQTGDSRSVYDCRNLPPGLAEKTINLTGAIINEICRQVKQLAAREFIAKIDAANLIPILQIRRDHFDVIINTAPRSISDAVIKNFETYTMRLHQLKYYK